MQASFHHYPAYNLFSNFLTHSYFNLLEQCYAYEQSKHTEEDEQEYAKMISSFIFVLGHSNNGLYALQKQIYNYYIPYTHLSKSNILKTLSLAQPLGTQTLHVSRLHLSHAQAKKCYITALSTLSKATQTEQIKACNITFIQLYFYLSYTLFPDEASLPDLLKVHTAKDFALLVYHKHFKTLMAKGQIDVAQKLITNLPSNDANFHNSLKYLLKNTLERS